MKTITIDAETRAQTGKGSARSTRREGRIPGVLYGQGKNIPLSVDRRAFVRAMNEARGENLIFDVTLPSEAPLKSIARDVQMDPISRGVVHIDFLHIDMSKPIQISIQVNLSGEPEGVKNFGGILEHPARTLDVECLPSNIPSSIEIDVSELMIGDSIHVSDITPDGYEFLEEQSKVIAQVAAPTVATVEEEEAEAAAAAEAEADGAEGDEGDESTEESKGDGKDG